MNRKNKVFLIIISFLSVPDIYADIYAPGEQYFEACRAKALSTVAGNIIKVELKLENDRQVYEFDIRDENNSDWDIECLADTAEIIEVEEEVTSTRDEKFLKSMNIELAQAKSIALNKFPGEIIEVEFEIEEDGLAVYEFDIKTEQGNEIKLEVNAVTGEIHEINQELWQIGYE